MTETGKSTAGQTEDEHRGVLLHVPERLVRIIGEGVITKARRLDKPKEAQE